MTWLRLAYHWCLGNRTCYNELATAACTQRKSCQVTTCCGRVVNVDFVDITCMIVSGVNFKNSVIRAETGSHRLCLTCVA